MPSQTDELRSFWNVDSLEQAQHERVTVPARPEAWSDEIQAAENAAIIARFPPPPLKILDYGCGVGRIARQFLRTGHEIVGVDISPNMLAYARQYCQPLSAAWVLTDGYSLPLPDAAVDGAYSFYVFQHMPSFEMVVTTLREIHRVLAPGGTFVLQTIDNLGTGSGATADIPSFIGVRQTPGSLRTAVTQIGFQTVAEVIHEHSDHHHLLFQLTKRT